MIKVNVIEKEVEHQHIKLKDCKVGDVVELGDGETALVVGSSGVIESEYCDEHKGLVLFCEEFECEMGEGLSKEAIEGDIVRIIGTLTGIEVTAK